MAFRRTCFSHASYEDRISLSELANPGRTERISIRSATVERSFSAATIGLTTRERGCGKFLAHCWQSQSNRALSPSRVGNASVFHP
jgi:hypothetical protein